MKENEEVTKKMRLDAAKRYALAERTDPWALPRALAHMRNGIAGFTEKGEDAFYTADNFVEERVTSAGSPYHVTVYRNIVRP